MIAVPDHDMVVQLDPESLGGRFQFPRHPNVVPRRL